jgi:hypothetical protein
MKPVSLEVSMMKRIGELNKELTDCKAEADLLKEEVIALRIELAEAQENYHLVNEMVKRLVK